MILCTLYCLASTPYDVPLLAGARAYRRCRSSITRARWRQEHPFADGPSHQRVRHPAANRKGLYPPVTPSSLCFQAVYGLAQSIYIHPTFPSGEKQLAGEPGIVDPVTAHKVNKMRSAHLLATGVLLTSHGLGGTEALGWRDKGSRATGGTSAEEAGSLRYRERDDTSITELGEWRETWRRFGSTRVHADRRSLPSSLSRGSEEEWYVPLFILADRAIH